VTMDIGAATVLSAAIVALGTLLTSLVQKTRKENRNDHAEVRNELRSLRTTLERVESKHDRHIEWHVEGENNAKPKRVNTKRSA
jgi:hypothetical protein